MVLNIVHNFEHCSRFWVLFTILNIVDNFECCSWFWTLFTILSVVHDFEYCSQFERWSWFCTTLFMILKIVHDFECCSWFWTLLAIFLNVFKCSTFLDVVHDFEHCSQFCTLFTVLNIFDVFANRFFSRVGRIFLHEIGTGVSLKEKRDIIIKLMLKWQHNKHTHKWGIYLRLLNLLKCWPLKRDERKDRQGKIVYFYIQTWWRQPKWYRQKRARDKLEEAKLAPWKLKWWWLLNLLTLTK